MNARTYLRKHGVANTPRVVRLVKGSVTERQAQDWASWNQVPKLGSAFVWRLRDVTRFEAFIASKSLKPIGTEGHSAGASDDDE